MERYLCIHGHFYQPPRENPWLEAVELQDSAYPYHDWNERINAECYAPNGSARILDGEGRIARLVNNYARISFNFGPTLLAWLEQHVPATYRPSSKPTATRSADSPGTARPWPKSTTTSSCRWPRAATRSRRWSGASATLCTASAGTPRGCGWRRPRSIWRRSTSWPSTASASPSCRRTRPPAGGRSARKGGKRRM